MKIKDVYENPSEDLSEEELRFLIFNKYVFKRSTISKIYRNYEVFCSSLCEDYVRTINAIKAYEVDDISFSEMDEDTSSKIYEKLEKEMFCIDDKKVSLIGYNPLFLLRSLESNYYKTISVLLRSNDKKAIKIPSFIREDKMIYDLLVDSEFVINSKNLSLIENSNVFLLASLNNDFEKTIKVLSKSELIYIDMSFRDFMKLVDELFFKNKADFSKLPVSLKNVIVSHIKEYSSFENSYSTLKSLLEKKKIPLSYMKGEVLYASSDLLDMGCDSYDEREFLYSRIWSYSMFRFNPSDEKKLLKLLGDKYKKCSCVEDVLRQMHSKNITRDKMSLLEMFSLSVYCAKELHRIGSSVFVDSFAVSSNMNELGCFNGKLINLYINGSNNSVKDMVNTLHHEIEHVIQKYNTLNNKTNADRDIDVYYKDYILRDILIKDDYYRDNYIHFFSEYDADLKANIKTYKLFSSSKEILKEDVFRFMEASKFELEKAKDNVSSKWTSIRCVNGDFYEINELFEREMLKIQKEDRAQFLSILQEYPLIKYEYNIVDFGRKSMLELVNDMDECNSKYDVGIYYNLLRSRVDYNKENGESVFESYNDLVKLHSSERYSGITKKILFSIINEYHSKKSDKYAGYLYRMNQNKR